MNSECWLWGNNLILNGHQEQPLLQTATIPYKKNTPAKFEINRPTIQSCFTRSYYNSETSKAKDEVLNEGNSVQEELRFQMIMRTLYD